MAGLRCLGALLLLHVVTHCDANSPPSISGTFSSRKVAKLGKKTTLECPVEGDDPELIEWRKYGRTIPNFPDKFKQNNRRGSLRITNIEMEDAGNYTCVATNGFGSVNVNFTLIVHDPKNNIVQEGKTQFRLSEHEDLKRPATLPFFPDEKKLKTNQNMMKPKGSTVRLMCPAEGNPRPLIHWRKNGQNYSQKDQHKILKVSNLRENATYTCVASNRLGQVDFTYNVGVVAEIQTPRLTSPFPEDKTIQEGKTVSFKCYIESRVKPTVQWFKRVDKPEDIPHNTTPVFYNNERFVVLKQTGHLLVHGDGSFFTKLKLNNVQPKDAGMYVCWAANKEGNSMRNATLTVESGGGFQDQYQRHDNRNQHTNYQDFGSRDSSESSNDSSNSDEDTDDNDLNLPLLIGIPCCALLILIILTVFLMQRSDSCCCSQSNSSAKPPRPPVPTHEREAYYYSTCQPQQQTINPLLVSREKLPKTPTPSVDMTCSEFSSVSRTHPSHHHFYHQPNHINNHMNYGY